MSLPIRGMSQYCLGAILKQPNWTRILTVLLVILAVYALLYIAGSTLARFTHTIFLFVMAAIVAYILNPMVNFLEAPFRARWLAILLSYVSLAIGLFTLSVFLFTPFIQQSQSLIDNLHTPSTGSLRTMKSVVDQTTAVRMGLSNQKSALGTKGQLSSAEIRRVDHQIAVLQHDMKNLENGTLSGSSRAHNAKTKLGATRLPPNPEPQTAVPPSYVTPINKQIQQVASLYKSAVQDPSNVDDTVLSQAESQAVKARSEASHMYHVMSTTPILLIRSQTWLDQHGIATDLHAKFGQAASQVSNQGTYILDNAITIVSATANVLLNTTLVLIITFYFLSDGGGLIHGGLNLVPAKYREQVWFFILSLDKVLGGYIRGQIFLSALSGVLAGGGAAVLGVPYPLLIGIVTFLLQWIPVIGPLIAFIPPLVISLFFMPVTTTVVFGLYFIAFQQLVTNIVGPRINSKAVGIHPLEAILAVLVGYPIAGFLGAFLAVPIAGVIHIVVREMYAYFAHGKSLPTAVVPVTEAEAERPSPRGSIPIEPDIIGHNVRNKHASSEG